MKFTKEQAVEKLNQELTNNGKKTLRMSTRTLEAQTETLMTLLADEEMELDDFVKKVKPSLETVNSQIEHDNSDFIKEYKKNHPDTKPDDKKDDKTGDDDPLKKIMEELAEMKRLRLVDEEAKAIEAKRSEIRKYLDDNNVKDAKWIDSVLSIANIGKDDNAEEKGKQYLELYNHSKTIETSFTPSSPTAGGDDKIKEAFAGVRALRSPETANK